MTTLETMYAPQVNSPATTISANISSSATSISVLNGSVLPAAPNLLVIGGDTDSAETVRMTAKSGNTLTVVRGVQGTAKSWSTGATIARLFTAKDLSDVQTNITALNSGKAEVSDLTAVEDRVDDVYASSASGSIANFYRTVGGLPVDDLTIDITPVQAGSGDPAPDNVRAISGYTGANIVVNNKNLFSNLADGYLSTNGTVVAASSTNKEKYTQHYIALGDATAITFSAKNSTNVQWWAGVCFYGENKTIISRSANTLSTAASIQYTFTNFPAGAKFVKLTARTYGSTDIQFEFGSEATGIVASSYNATSISWNTEAGTVYGGTLDVTTGLLTVSYVKSTVTTVSGVYGAVTNGYCVYVDMTGGYRFNCDPAKMVSNIFLYSAKGRNTAPLYAYGGNDGGDGRVIFMLPNTVTSKAEAETWFANNATEFTYQLATPVTYQLTPVQVTSLLGENNIWADTGNTTATFGADIKSYIDNTTGGKQDKIFASGILKGNGSGGVSAAVAGTDYQAPLTAGTDYQTPLAENALQYYGVCSTSASTQTKTVTIDGITALTTGLEIRVKMTNAQTYNGTPKLNVNSLGAKNIMQHGSTAAVRYQWQAGEVVSLTYDGTYWVLENNSLADTTYFGLTRLSSATDSTLEDCAATPKAVKTAYDLANAAVPNTAKGVSVATLDGNTKVTAAQASSYMFMLQENTTLTASHEGCMLVCTGNITITIPSTLTAGTEIEILNYGTGVITVTGASGVSLNGASAGSKTIPDQYTSGVLKAISASQWVIQGAIE